MGFSSRSGRAVTNPSAPRAFGCCDRCGIWYNLDRLKWQYQWAGTKLQNLRLRVCDECLDDPQPQLKAKLLPGADPVPVKDPRPEWFAQSENSILSTNDRQRQITTDPAPGSPILIE